MNNQNDEMNTRNLPDADDEIDLLELWRVLVKYKRMILVTMFAAAIQYLRHCERSVAIQSFTGFASFDEKSKHANEQFRLNEQSDETNTVVGCIYAPSSESIN